ncbi:D-alanine--D-alanine ligase [Desulfonatronum sp. SC1]|uniref:D-alanine--D-alanine ligase n=1 Tax=Desulfonatronum sp. SC1 TaxID=2109626 RepID=UPI000D314D78|nr:D-alanine--D-alanine ligase [Desulfonatronum sp. SC1]PTN36785.1 D-alanine--D-alanine ligase [Desulfonatronum sp. SC1]
MKILVAHSPLEEAASLDDADVLAQVRAVAEAATRLGHYVEVRPWPDVALTPGASNAPGPFPDVAADLVVNLVESIQGSARHVHHIPDILVRHGLPCTGSPARALERSTSKLLAKADLTGAGLPTPVWLDHQGRGNEVFPGTYIVKSVWEHASHGLDADNVLAVIGPEELMAAMRERQRNPGGEWFAEAYVPGREFNLALLANPDADETSVQVLAPAEIRFLDFPADQPQVVGFRAKWLEQSFEYQNTVRELEFPKQDAPLLAELSALALECWRVFGLEGYARVDFRVDRKGRPWIIDVNANPCLSPDAGFQAALSASGLTFDTALGRIFRAAMVQLEVP